MRIFSNIAIIRLFDGLPQALSEGSPGGSAAGFVGR
jgi:hypothetical protein